MPSYFYRWMTLVLHIPLDVDTCHFWCAVGTHGDALFEVSRHFTLSVVYHLDGAFLTGSNGGFGILWCCAATTCHSLVDDKWSVAHVGERESAFLYGILGAESAKVVYSLVKFDFSLFLCCHLAYGANEQQCHHDNLFHTSSYLGGPCEFPQMIFNR